MRQSLRLGRVAGIPVGAHWSVFVILALIAYVLAGSILPQAAAGRSPLLYWAIGVPTALVFLASLLAHEAAHALVARRRGVGVRSITLWMLGGVAQLEDDPPNARADLSIAAAGPLTSLAAGVVMLGAAEGASLVRAPTVAVAALAWIGATNVFLAAFNLLPGAPLDGGRVLRALVWMRSGDRGRGERVATGAGQVVGAGLAGAGVAQLIILGQTGGLWLMFIGWFLIWAAGAEARSRVVRQASIGVRVRDVMTAAPDCAPAWRPVGEFSSSVAVRSHQTVFPVTGFDGEPCGVVTLDRLSHVPAARAADRVDSVALPLPQEYVVSPDDPASCLLRRPPIGGAVVAVAVSGGHVAGLVTVDDLTRLVRQSALREKGATSPG
jgi:Zn-dependent protease